MSKNETLAKIPRSDGGINAANMNGGPLAGMRNKVINGDFDHWQRGVSQTLSGYGSADRWFSPNTGSTKTASRQAFPLGDASVPGQTAYFMRHVVASVAGAANFAALTQRIESVRTLAGKKATLTFWAKADAPKNIAVEFLQRFGTGGAPSADVIGIGAQLVALTAAWAKYSILVDIPAINGKTLGSNSDDFLAFQFWFDAGANFAARTAGHGQQSGTFDIAHVSLVEGDARGEDDPFSPRHPQQELALCQRYYQKSYPSNVSPGTAGQDNCLEAFSASGTRDELLIAIAHKVEMRSNPTITPYSWNSGAAGKAALIGGGNTDVNVDTVGGGTPAAFRIRPTANQTAPARMGYHYTADAEL